ncbi:MAG: heavy metal-associated domain-containing protein [Bacteroidota bacterium]|nr:heavy metal-associated domain-containing protein [Bacteroidota bacterium]
MKLFNPTSLTCFILLASIFANTSPLLSQTQKPVKSQTVTYTVTDMGCSTDQKILETALYRKKGIKKVAIQADKITITFNPQKISNEEIIKVIENTGTCEDPNDKIHKVKSSTL